MRARADFFACFMLRLFRFTPSRVTRHKRSHKHKHLNYTGLGMSSAQYSVRRILHNRCVIYVIASEIESLHTPTVSSVRSVYLSASPARISFVHVYCILRADYVLNTHLPIHCPTHGRHFNQPSHTIVVLFKPVGFRARGGRRPPTRANNTNVVESELLLALQEGCSERCGSMMWGSNINGFFWLLRSSVFRTEWKNQQLKPDVIIEISTRGNNMHACTVPCLCVRIRSLSSDVGC